MSDNLNIVARPAEQTDLSGLQSVANQTWRQTYASLIPHTDINIFLEQAYSIERLEAALDVLGTGLIVANQGSQIVGYAQAGVTSDGRAELFAIYVLPEYQGLGIGRKLWQQAAAHLSDLGHDTFFVWVLDGNHQARRFYERQNAVAVEERPFKLGEVMLNEVGYLAKSGEI